MRHKSGSVRLESAQGRETWLPCQRIRPQNSEQWHLKRGRLSPSHFSGGSAGAGSFGGADVGDGFGAATVGSGNVGIIGGKVGGGGRVGSSAVRVGNDGNVGNWGGNTGTAD